MTDGRCWVDLAKAGACQGCPECGANLVWKMGGQAVGNAVCELMNVRNGKEYYACWLHCTVAVKSSPLMPVSHY